MTVFEVASEIGSWRGAVTSRGLARLEFRPAGRTSATAKGTLFTFNLLGESDATPAETPSAEKVESEQRPRPGESAEKVESEQRPRGDVRDDDHPAARELREYFAGRRRAFTVPVDLTACPPFTRRVLEALCDVPFGATVTYGELAARAGNPRAARAVGQAVGSNPVPVVVPCHRVLASGGRLGGFGLGLDAKRALLALEGVRAR